MPQVSLTPLGRQLRSVLNNIGALRLGLVTAKHSGAPTESLPTRHSRRQYETTAPKYSAAVAAVVETEPASARSVEDAPAAKEVEWYKCSKTRGGPRRNRKVRVDHIRTALEQTTEARFTTAKLYSHKPDLTYVNPLRRASQAARQNAVDWREESLARSPLASRDVTLAKVFADYLVHRNDARRERAKGATAFVPSPAQSELLAEKGYGLDILAAWADIITPSDSYEAAQGLAECVTIHGPQSLPLFILLHMLRRPYISPRALRIIALHSQTILEYRTTKHRLKDISPNAVFILFLRLSRHARMVLPMLLKTLAQMLVEFLPPVTLTADRFRLRQLRALTFMLNKAMRLLVLPVAVHPMKQNYLQESAVVRILAHMSDHQPALQINREGYRAVVTLQLAQEKRPKEQQWAELKSPSWPPWKVDRNAMDAHITAEDHGMSKAAETLRQMGDAGYGPLRSEKMAWIYAGWDTDSTPTVQTRTSFKGGAYHLGKAGADWAARIHTTSTVQEAWASYLAYTDLKLQPNEEVYLAVFQKLHKEAQRILKGTELSQNQAAGSSRPLYPGDTQDVRPLPSSSHHHTYTRTPPPSVDGFYLQLWEQGVVLHGLCLAYLVANAKSLSIGIEYIRDAWTAHSSLQSLLQPSASDDLHDIPMPIFTAFVKLLSRFSNVPMPKHVAQPRYVFHSRTEKLAGGSLTGALNGRNALARTADLLARRQPLQDLPWQAFQQALARSHALTGMSAFFAPASTSTIINDNEEDRQCRNALLAHHLMRNVLSMRKAELHSDLTLSDFRTLCISTEITIIACWTFLRASSHRAISEQSGVFPVLLPEVTETISANSTAYLRNAFDECRGIEAANTRQSSVQGGAMSLSEESPLLAVPNAAELHSYVRALGWMADYDELLRLLRWMVKARYELQERIGRDRNGEQMIRKVLVAVRVFLERQWVLKSSATEAKHGEMDSRHEPLLPALQSLETPSPSTVVDEIRNLIDTVDEWGGWPDDVEVEAYCSDQRFQPFMKEL